MRAVADRDHSAQMAAYFRFRLPTDLYCVAVGTGLAIFGPLFFATLYDPRYHDAGTYVAILGAGLVAYPLSMGRNLLVSNQRFKFLAIVTVIKTLIFLTTMTLAISYGSMKWAVLVIALQNVPDWILYFLVPGSGVPFRWRRDVPLILLAVLLLALHLPH
jgi:O-antigen/teichoic acid export membrane protein